MHSQSLALRLRHKVALHKAALALIRMARDGGHNHLYSQVAENEPRAAAWHRRLGFIQHGNVWILNLNAPA